MQIILETNDQESLNLEKYLDSIAKVWSELKLKKQVCYILLSEEEMIQLNNEVLQHNYCTDIITFDYFDDEDFEYNEIYICPKQVMTNAQEFKTNEEEEMLRVAIHGLLHLSGLNDKTEEEQTIMREKENYYIHKIVSRENII